MVNFLTINKTDITRLSNQPNKKVDCQLGDINFSLEFAIPNYQANIAKYYSDIVANNLLKFSNNIDVPIQFQHFGLVCKFAQPVELHVHDRDMTLSSILREMIKKYGVVILKNAYMDFQCRNMGHKNRFPHLNFHVDRNPSQGTVYSVYSRNPYDEEQRYPRNSSTLMTANIVGYLQSVRCGQTNIDKDKGCCATYNGVFSDEDIKTQINNVVLEHKWDEPEGVGEISMLDNRTAIHASYYYNKYKKAYRIGVRYLK